MFILRPDKNPVVSAVFSGALSEEGVAHPVLRHDEDLGELGERDRNDHLLAAEHVRQHGHARLPVREKLPIGVARVAEDEEARVGLAAEGGDDPRDARPRREDVGERLEVLDAGGVELTDLRAAVEAAVRGGAAPGAALPLVIDVAGVTHSPAMPTAPPTASAAPSAAAAATPSAAPPPPATATAESV